jgi:hypothetical protein
MSNAEQEMGEASQFWSTLCIIAAVGAVVLAIAASGVGILKLLAAATALVPGFALCVALQGGAVVSTFVSLWLIGDKRRSGLWWGEIANAFWFALYVHHGLFGLIVVPLVLAALYARALWRWRS